MAKILLSMSGGVDSTVVLSMLLKEGVHEIHPVAFTYGSKHNKYENKAAKDICKYYNLESPLLIDLFMITQHFTSALLKSGEAIPEGHYEDLSMKKTVVPSRNMIFLSILAGIAESKLMDAVAIGVHQGDHFIYPDCRPEFIRAMKETIFKATEGKIGIYHPLLYLKKVDIVKIGLQHDAPLHLTRTCYKDQPIACGKCGSCVERLEAFAQNNSLDPIKYEI